MQGSPSGPVFWNILYDGMLRLNFSEHVMAQAYADDAFLLVCGASIAVATERANTALNLIWEWGQHFSLSFNASKTQCLCIGRGSESTPPTVTMGGTPITFTKTIKCLGVILDHQLSFTDHIKDVCARTQSAVSRFARLARTDWGLGPRAMKSIWQLALEPALTYASPVWAGKATVLHNARRLKTVQRLALLRTAQAYRTVSHEALYTITGVTPILLRIQELSAHYYVRRCSPPVHTHYCPPLLSSVDFTTLTPNQPFFSLPHPALRLYTSSPPNPSHLAAFRTITNSLVTAWQEQWLQADTGRLTFSFLPSIEVRLDNNFTPDHILTQYLSGHGDFRAYLHRFALRPDSLCGVCSSPDTVHHRLISCPLFADHRSSFQELVGQSPTTLEDFAPFLTNSGHIKHFRQFIANCHNTASAQEITA
jgi:hypothetical protein